MRAYYDTISEVLKDVGAVDGGLTSAEAAKRLDEQGKNELVGDKKKSWLSKFLAQFKDLMIIVLISAALVSAAVALYQRTYADLVDSGLIMLIVIINALIGVTQESKAEAALEALKNMNKPFSKVMRDGRVEQINSADIVVGDIVQLDAGDIVPADLRLLKSASLKIEEAALTGESVPSEKHYGEEVPEGAPLGDRVNMAYSSGMVSYGRGLGVVVATGMDTEVGKIAAMLSDSGDSTTPLQRQLAKTAKLLSFLVLGIAAIIFAASLIRDPSSIIKSFMTAVAIAVAAIPEGLPAVVTIVLAIGVQRMSREKAIVRNLPAVETLGCCQIICSDKTGTLTLNKMTVKQVFTLSDGAQSADEYIESTDGALLIRAMTLCNDTAMSGGGLVGDPTETALVAFAQKTGVDYTALCSRWKRVDEVPFDSIRKLMTTVNANGDTVVAHIKGATDIMLNRCNRIMVNGMVREMTAEDIAAITAANHGMASKALRVLGVAVKYDNTDDTESIERDMVFVGLVGMIDPPRAEVRDAVRVAVGAGIRPIMITGDHRDTAMAIATEIGILSEGDKVMTGTEIDALSDEQFRSIIDEYRVFARVSPENKVRIVQAYRSFGLVVAMTGDGVNDAPSIKEADIGIGMGITGTDVSKGAADMILADDNFATIVSAVEEGRKVYNNILKAVCFLLSANIAEVLCLFIATVFLGVDILTPVMILWINLVTDSLPALSLGVEDSETGVMDAKPRQSKSSLFGGSTGKDILIQGAMQTCLVMLSYCMGHYVLDSGHEAVGMTMAFVTLCIIQLFHSFNLKSEHNSIFHRTIFKNKWLNISFLVGVVLVLAVTLIPPIRSIFDTARLSFTEWMIALGCSIIIVPFVEIQKLIERKLAAKKAA